jgi:hypothetical protein
MGRFGVKEEETFFGLVCDNHAIVFFECPLEGEHTIQCQVWAIQNVIMDACARWADRHLAKALVREAVNIIRRREAEK